MLKIPFKSCYRRVVRCSYCQAQTQLLLHSDLIINLIDTLIIVAWLILLSRMRAGQTSVVLSVRTSSQGFRSVKVFHKAIHVSVQNTVVSRLSFHLFLVIFFFCILCMATFMTYFKQFLKLNKYVFPSCKPEEAPAATSFPSILYWIVALAATCI